MIVTSTDEIHIPTEAKYIIMFYPSITRYMVNSHCDILVADNSGAGLGRHPTDNYESGLDEPQKQAVIAQKRLRSNMRGLLIKNSLTTDSKRRLKAFRSEYTSNTQDYGASMFFVIVKMV